MLDSELNNQAANDNANSNETSGQPAAPAPVPAAVFQAPQVLFQPPAQPAVPGPDRDGGARDSGARDSGARDGERGAPDPRDAADGTEPDAGAGRASRRTRGGRGRGGRPRDAAPADDDLFSVASADAASAVAEVADADGSAAVAAGSADETDEGTGSHRRRRRAGRGRSRGEAAAADEGPDSTGGEAGASDEPASGGDGDGERDADSLSEEGASGRRRRRKRRRGSADADVPSPDDPPDTVVHVREPHQVADDVRAIKGSTRLEAKKQRRREGRESGRRRPPVVTESEFLARRESVERTMVVRQRGDRTQIAVLEDGVLVEHYVNRTTHQSYVGNVYLGKVQNVLPSMEAAFVDIGKGRNAVLYAGEVNFDASGLEGQPKRIESALKPGQSVIVQVTKDPVGHKGARLTSQVSLPGRYLVYVPGASMTGISRKLPDTERNRLKQILKKVTPENAGVIVRTAAEGAAEAELDVDVTRLAAQWESIEKKARTASAPALLYGEPDLTIRVVRDVFNEDFTSLIVSGDQGWDTIDEYVKYVAPHLADRLSRWEESGDPDPDVFTAYRIDEQLAKALERKVWLPSGGSLVIDRTEAMTVIDVNTGKFTGQGGNLEETVTRNNLEAAEEIVRQLRLRDVGGIVVIDFIDMVLESNRELVLRRLLECLARDRTKHQVAEVTSLGLVQMTRKRVGAGLLEAFSQQCECCNGRGVIITLDSPPAEAHRSLAGTAARPIPAPPLSGNGNGRGSGGNGGGGNGSGGNGGKRQGNGAAAGRRGQDAPAKDRAAADRTPADRTAADRTAAASETVGIGAGSGGGGRRTRRSTAGGTAFAAAVEVEDTPAVAAVVPVATTLPVPAAQPADTAPAAVGTSEDAPPVRRTRSGSAVARVSVSPESPAPESPAAESPAAPETAAPSEDPAEPESQAGPASQAEPETPAEPEAPAEPEVPAEPEGLVVPEAPEELTELEGLAEAQSLAEPEAPADLLSAEVPEIPSDAVAGAETPVSPASEAGTEAPAAPAADGSDEAGESDGAGSSDRADGDGRDAANAEL